MTPFTETELQKLTKELSSIKTFLPDNKMTYIWNSVNKLREKKNPQPCSCKSAGGLWAAAVKELRDFVDAKGNQ
tara:strand:- start:230 stop:451 length:222 start_codon:yes stop_codon:yes gene_type:complete